MNPQSMVLCESSRELNESFVRLYELAFPASEREKLSILKQRLEENKFLYHRTTSEQGDLLCFSTILLSSDFSILTYMATDPSKRSAGVGGKHLLRLVELLKVQYPHHRGMFLEIEATQPQSETITEEQHALRLRRRNFYEKKIGARVLTKRGSYLMPSFADQQKLLEGEVLVVEFGQPLCRQTIASVLQRMFHLSYQLPADHHLVHRAIGGIECEIPVCASDSNAVHATASVGKPIGGDADSGASVGKPIGGDADSGASVGKPIGGDADSGASVGKPIGRAADSGASSKPLPLESAVLASAYNCDSKTDSGSALTRSDDGISDSPPPPFGWLFTLLRRLLKALW